MDTYLGFITPFPWNWAPQNWTLCNGSLMQIQQYSALYALIGPTFGGNGTTTFGLPDLRGRQIIGMGQGPGLTNRIVGQAFGTESVTLTANNLPPHNHTLTASNTAYSSLTQSPANNWTLGAASSVSGDREPVITPVQMYGPPNPGTPVQSAPTSSAGNGLPVTTMPPALCLNFCIALMGIFPSRN
ncbi:MAG: phage tail protein [Gammaproteobacteria bacterium HGW-Gammaproteobacteria-1]|jgi:microcystin-dependent protein|nr:MAG: phage tail protein [Gammaproteobacteria bacterium HGW-Gammaproteobacteria-1]